MIGAVRYACGNTLRNNAWHGGKMLCIRKQLGTSFGPVYAPVKLTFFSKDTCQLCTNAKEVLDKAMHHQHIRAKELDLELVDIMDPKNSKWFDMYCYDVPVLHIERPDENKPVKFMHYFDEGKIVEEINK
ncbi:Piso0_005423 [Millerozyma farinosa CBS 7064]|uniref:Glutaredoxin-like protein n=1 Tax=Pichia sorbitophila (strain ATCC MYA-4447 / BCRC 22081 / CBS 7064 / NBRC 10061 / NRRL Y-12695) TaxID=559304 RepID=G8Y525_PICSO|nr:Piso0_005423 [Millerozyma farinosa CBS 7064]